jgi:hypothetical protein
MDLDLASLKMPDRLGVNYDEHIVREKDVHEVREIRMGRREAEPSPVPASPSSDSPPATKLPEQPKKQKSLMDDDDDIFNSISKPAETKPSGQDTSLGGFSFESNVAQPPSVQPAANSNNLFDMGLDFGGGSQAPPPNAGGQSNLGFGGDLLGFGESSSTHSQPPVNQSGGGDLMGFGFAQVPSHPPQVPTQAPGGFLFDSSPNSSPTYPPQPSNPTPPQNSFGFDLMGTGSSQQAPKPPASSQQFEGFTPISNTNPNKIMAYENQHVQIWMDCEKESNDTTKLFTTYINKTNNTLTNLTIQAAVVKHVKLTINPLSSTTLQPYSKEVVHQVYHILFRQWW